MKKFSNFISEVANTFTDTENRYKNSLHKLDSGLYDKEWDKYNSGKDRFYVKNSNGTDSGYFKVGSKVNIPADYSDSTQGTVVHGGYMTQSDNEHTYVVRRILPRNHPEAVDADGEHTPGSNIKYNFYGAKTLTKHNPRS